MRNYIALIIILTFSLFSCKQEATSDKHTENKTEVTTSKKKSSGTKFSNYPGPMTSTNLRGKAQSMLDYRREHSEVKSWPIIESGVWKFAFVFNGDNMERPSESISKWIDFKQDGTFEYGEGKDIITSGQYHYDLDKAELLILDKDDRSGPNAWKVNLIGDAMILLGNAELTSSGFQIKMVKLLERP